MKLLLENWREYLTEATEEPNLVAFSEYFNNKIVSFLLNPRTANELQAAREGEEFSVILDKGELFANYETLNDVYLAVTVNDKGEANIKAYYLCVPEDRSQSNLVIEANIPRQYAEIEEFEEWLDIDLEDALSHELQHSCDTSEMLGADIPEGEAKWESLENIYKHFASEAETRGHLAGARGRVRAMERRGYEPDINEIVTDKITTVFEEALERGFTEEELGPVMQAIWQEWTNYLKGWN
jgi:hypothetical protein